MTAPDTAQAPVAGRILAGPPASAGAEPWAAHLARLGPRPVAASARQVLPLLDASGLLGRGGAGFPVGRKWRTVAERGGGSATVIVNGAEGEPLSRKDRTLMAHRPHLVLDGALLAAEVVGAEQIVLYVGEAHGAASAALARALAERDADRHRERGAPRRPPISLVAAPDTYVAGEESAAVHFVNDGDARPTSTPPRVFERGVNGRPTLVQNVESLAHAALIARYGDAWYRSAGQGTTRGTALVTLSAGERREVREIELGQSLAEIGELIGADPGRHGAVLLGGYFGGWLDAEAAWHAALDPQDLRAAGRSFGCGVVAFLDRSSCGVAATARIMEYMAGASAAQCGPCVFGLRAIADATSRIATSVAASDDLERVERWSRQLAGRGACRHPDGAVGLLNSALDVFAEEFALHQDRGWCSARSSGRQVA